MKKKNTALEELTAMLNENNHKPKEKKRLLEDYLTESDFDPSMADETMEYAEDDFPMDGMQGGQGDKMAQEKGILPIKNEIDQIRQIALKTIARLAENPTSESYQMMKKIWMTCDKAIESALQPENDSKKSNSF